MDKDNKKYIKILGYVISAIFLYFTFKDTDFSLIFKHLHYVNFYYIVGALILTFCFFAIRGIYQINNLHYIKSNITFSNSITSVAIALFYNAIFPARLGEIIRTLYLSEKEGIKKASILSYIFIEKVLDFLVMILFLSIIIIFGFNIAELKKVLILSFFIIILITSVIFFYIKFNSGVLHLLKKVIPSALHEFLNKINIEALDGFKFYRSFKQVFRGVSLLFISWMIILGVYWLVSYPYVKLLGLPYYSCLFFLTFSALSLSIPSAPSGIGVMHYGLFLAVKLLINNSAEMQVNMVAAFVIVMHFFTTLFDLVTGGGIILYDKIVNKSKSYSEREDD